MFEQIVPILRFPLSCFPIFHVAHMTQFGIIQSPLSQTLTEDGITIEIIIFRDADEDEWTLEILDHNDGSTIWEDGFETEEDALEEALRAVEEDGIASFAKALAINVH